MKKVKQMVVLAAFVGLAINTFADVQNIRISGDIRIRGYELVNTAGSDDEDQVKNKDNFISQRTRVTVEADLEDHILAVVTLRAEGLWGSNDEAVESETGLGDTPGGSAGAGLAGVGNRRINRGWDLGINEAYVQFSEMFYAPMTLKVGRQYLNYGHGLIFSSAEQEYNFDAARLVLDYYPLTIDVVYARLGERSSFGPGSSTKLNDIQALFINGRYEFTDSLIKNIEAYFGYVINGNDSSSFDGTSRIPPIANSNGDSPMLIGLRGDVNLTENFQTWFEGAYEFGSGSAGTTENISAFLANVGGKLTLKDVNMVPAFNFNYIYASGGGSEGEHSFRPWFDYVDGYNGHLFMPLLSNIHVFNLGASVKPSENTSVSVQGFYYLKVDKDSSVGSNPNVDFGGIGFFSANDSREIGWEIDTILGYDYSKDVRFQLVYAAFIPGNALHADQAADSVAHLVRGEINARF